ncbi:uncharacterized protein LOC123671410 [Harmonia axyridis]|uniref:uncharacterized protein LOC123671410 n=1 Tax=Harmonia axyridis TaxID=115357 RepID=UPI001E2776DC|nr:uncharacterized protein LOC123671410 [Harmonia axyridis]
MDTKEKLIQTFEKLDFSSKFPSSFHVNPSTNFIWQQMILNLKPKKEVEVFRKNIIINRMENKLKRNSVQTPVPEIETYEKLKIINGNIAKIKARIQEKQNKHNFLHNNNKADYLIIDSMKQKNEEKKIKLHAVKLKSEQNENEIKHIQEILNKKEISGKFDIPIEVISENLKYLVEETEKCIGSNRYSSTNNLSYRQSSKINLSCIKNRTCFSSMKKSQNKNELQRFVSCSDLPVVKALFTENFKENNRTAKTSDDLSHLDTSGDLLPESCFDFKADDEFLTSSQPTYCQKYIKSNTNLTSKRENTLRSISNIFEQSSLFPEEKMEQKHDYFSKALENKNIIGNIEELFYRGNIDIIWNSICSILKDIKMELEMNMKTMNFKSEDICDDDLLPLSFIYIKNNLLCLKYRKQIKILKNCIREKKYEIEKKLNNLDKERLEALQLQLDKIKLGAEINFLYKEVYNDNNIDNGTTLKTIRTKINNSRNDLFKNVEAIRKYIEIKADLMQLMKKCQEDTSICIKKLNKFLMNPSWADALKEDIDSKEIDVFQKYPMDYIKRFCFVDKNTFYRDSMNNFYLDQFVSKDILYEVTAVLEHPQIPPEKLFDKIAQRRDTLQILSSLEYPEVSIENNQDSLQLFQEKENYIHSFQENVNALIHSNKVHQILKMSSYATLNMDLWLDMPFRRFVSKEREVDGKKYCEYEESFNYFKNNE